MWCATRKVSLRVEQVMCPGGCCGGVLLRHWIGKRGDLLALRAEHPLLWGVGLRHSPPSSLGGFGLRHSPLRCRGGPCNNWKKAHRAPSGALCFFCTPSIPYASKLATVCPGTKKALKRCLRAFFRCCGERGIRTPGTVTRTSV